MVAKTEDGKPIADWALELRNIWNYLCTNNLMHVGVNCEQNAGGTNSMYRNMYYVNRNSYSILKLHL